MWIKKRYKKYHYVTISLYLRSLKLVCVNGIQFLPERLFEDRKRQDQVSNLTKI